MHLHTGSREPPPQYLELILCRDVYHCTPSELDEQDAERVADHLLCLQEESKYRRMRDQREKEKGRRRR